VRENAGQKRLFDPGRLGGKVLEETRYVSSSVPIPKNACQLRWKTVLATNLSPCVAPSARREALKRNIAQLKGEVELLSKLERKDQQVLLEGELRALRWKQGHAKLDLMAQDLKNYIPPLEEKNPQILGKRARLKLGAIVQWLTRWFMTINKRFCSIDNKY